MSDKEVYIIVAICAAIVVILFIVLVLSKTRRGEKKSIKNVNFYVNGGFGTDGYGDNVQNNGLKGFGDDKMGTVLVNEKTRKPNYICINLTNRVTGRKYSSKMQNELVIGRKSEDGIYPYLELSGETTISKRHALITRNENGVYITDMGSANHSWLNNQLLINFMPLNNGDIIRFGNCEYIIEIIE